MMNNGNGLVFGMGAPAMEGTWYNPKTGDSFVVRNSFFEDNEYIIQTVDGRIIRYNELQNYIQSDMPIEKLRESLKDEIKETEQDVPQSIKELLEDPMDSIYPQKTTLGNLADNNRHAAVQEPANDNNLIINRALDKSTNPNIDVNIKWNKFPEREISMLVDIMEVSVDDITDWYLKFLDTDYIVSTIKSAVSKYISDKVTPKVENPKVEKPKPKSKSKK